MYSLFSPETTHVFEYACTNMTLYISKAKKQQLRVSRLDLKKGGSSALLITIFQFVAVMINMTGQGIFIHSYFAI